MSASITAQQSYQTNPTPKLFSSLINNHSDQCLEAPSLANNDYLSDEEGGEEEEEKMVVTGDLGAGSVMGVYNAAIAAPQIVAALGSSGILWVLGRWGFDDGEAVGWVIRIWGLAGLVAAWLAAGIEKENDDNRE
jgi:solute carrier family 45 protein 1/2/4